MNVLITDGETCETPRNEQGQLDVKNGQVYDLGGGVLNLEQGKIIKEFSIINEDVFLVCQIQCAKHIMQIKFRNTYKKCAKVSEPL